MLNHLYALSIKVTACLALEQFLSMRSEDLSCQDCLEVLTARAAFGGLSGSGSGSAQELLSLSLW